MTRLLMISVALVCPLIAGLSASQRKSSQQRNRPPVINSFTSSMTRVEVCDFPDKDTPIVALLVKATDPDGDAVRYEYSTVDGTISGTGNLVNWNLTDVKRGPHQVRVTVTDARGGKVEATLTVTTVDHGSCDPPPPMCPDIKVSCSDEVEQFKPFKFSARIITNKAENYEPLTFHWALNAGRIVKGQDSREIEVSSTGADGFDNITATLDIRGFHPACTGTTASCTTKIIR